MTRNMTEVERRLWTAADNLRANSKLRSHEYSIPVLGLIFLAYADHRFKQTQPELGADAEPMDFQAEGVMYLPDGANLGAAINEAMNAIENEDLRGVLPKLYSRLDNSVLAPLLKAFSFEEIAAGLEGDAFGKVYEYFLNEFAKREGQLGGESYTPTSLVKLMVEIMEPFHGRVYDPACGSGGMFVQSARFVSEHPKNPTDELSVFGQEKTTETVRLARMNLAVHGRDPLLPRLVSGELDMVGLDVRGRGAAEDASQEAEAVA